MNEKGKNGRDLGNSTKFGLAGIGFALTMLGFAYAEVIALNSVVLAVVLTMGFVAPLVAGILEYVKGNSYRATSFVVHSLFFLSLYLFSTRDIGAVAPDLNTFGIFFMAWYVAILVMFAGTIMKKMGMKMIMNQIMIGLFGLFTLIVAIAYFTAIREIFIVAGAFALATALAILVNFIMHICKRIKRDTDRMVE